MTAGGNDEVGVRIDQESTAAGACFQGVEFALHLFDSIRGAPRCPRHRDRLHAVGIEVLAKSSVGVPGGVCGCPAPGFEDGEGA
ncbi:hypothetical protein A5643_08135 [Mycobacterium sp. 1274756.6]|nr:hypothetical protein A5643_08135 [Mycobacterium sp. 1274756.6]